MNSSKQSETNQFNLEMEKNVPEKDFEEEEDMEEDEDDVEEELQIHTPEDSEKDGKKKGKKSGRTSLSGRGVTLKMLLDDGVLAVEEGCMSIDYLVRNVFFCQQRTTHQFRISMCSLNLSHFKGQRFVADLLPNGKIKWEGSEKLFNSPSAWAIHCKKLVNPTKKSGCGWASVSIKQYVGILYCQ